MSLVKLKCASATFGSVLLAPLFYIFATASGHAQDSLTPASTTALFSAQSHPNGQTTELPRSFPGGADLPNGWRVAPAGKSIGTMGDLVLNLVVSPDGKIVVAVNSGFLPHGL